MYCSAVTEDTADDGRPDLAAMTMRLGRALVAIEQPILAAHDISMWGYVVLSELRRTPIRSQSALAASIGADKTRLIPVLDELERRGLIERRPDADDRRVHVLRLTHAGYDAWLEVRTDIRAAEDELLRPLPARDRLSFVGTLRKLSEATAKPLRT